MPARTIVRLAAPVASGLALWLASPPVGAGWLAWVALVPAAALALSAPATRLGRAALPLTLVVFLELLLVPALPFGLAADQWGDPVLPVLVGDSPVVVVALLVVPVFGLLLYAIRFPHFAFQRLPTSPAGALAAVLIPAVAWTALDLLRTKFDPGGFWGPLYLTQHDTAAAELATLAGPWLLTFALVAANYALALALVAVAGRGARTVRPRIAWTLRVALAPAAVVLALAAAAASVDSRAPGRETVRVAAIQPGYDTAEFELPVNRYLRRETRDLERASLELVADLTPLTEEAAARGARLAVWPEAAVWVDPRENARVRTALARLAQDTGLVVVVPYFLRGPDRGAALALLPDGTLTRAQGKQRPMWFLGENGGGEEPVPVDAGVASVGMLLGVDSQEPAPARRLTAAGADLLTSSTHDWEALAVQHAALARLHATSLGTAVVRSDWRHGSAIVDAGGRLVADAGSEKRRAVVVGDVATNGTMTPYARFGDALGWASVALTALFLAAGVLRLRRRLGGADVRTAGLRPGVRLK